MAELSTPDGLSDEDLALYGEAFELHYSMVTKHYPDKPARVRKGYAWVAVVTELLDVMQDNEDDPGDMEDGE